MQFGTASAVYASDRCGAFLSRAAETQVGRSVDVFFGASKRGVQITGSVVLCWLADFCWKTGRPNEERGSKTDYLVFLELE